MTLPTFLLTLITLLQTVAAFLRKRLWVPALSLYALCLMTAPAAANPIGKIQEMFKSATDLFLVTIIPILATCVLAWQGVQVAMGRKQFGDIVVVACGCVVAIAAPLIIKFFGS